MLDYQGSAYVLSDHRDAPPAWEMSGGKAEIVATFIGYLLLEAQQNGYKSDYLVNVIDSTHYASFDIFDEDDDHVAVLQVQIEDPED